MNNRNREQEQRERAQRERYSTSSYRSDEGDLGGSQQYESHYASRPQGPSSVLGGRQGRDRDIQGESSWRQGQQHASREGSYPQAGYGSPDDFSQRGDYARGGRGGSAYAGAGYGSSGYQGGRIQSQYGGSQGRSQDYGGRSTGYGAGSESYDDQDFAQDYSQGSSHYGSQGFGAQGSAGVYGPQGFGSQGGIGARSSEYGLGAGYSSSGGYSREGYGASQYAQGGSSNSGQWRTRDTTGQGYGGSTSYRGLGPKNYARSDERIREDLNEKLTDAHDIDASGLSVEVNNGVATLTGTVDQRWMKHRAEDLAESCSGVRDVNNQIRVTSPSGLQSGSQRSGAYGSSDTGSSLGSSGGASTTQGSSATGTSGQGSRSQSGMGQSSTTQSSASSASSGTSSGTGNGGSSGASTGNRSSGSTLS